MTPSVVQSLKHVAALLVMAGIHAALGHSPLMASGELELQVVDETTGEQIPVRMSLLNQRGRAIKPRNAISLGDHFVFDGSIVLKLADGTYTYEIDRGPEYRPVRGHFVIQRGATDHQVITMKRFVDMKQEGWWAGDLHVQRKPRDLKTLMLAEDLHVAHLVSWETQTEPSEPPAETTAVVPFGKQRCYHRLAGLDSSGGGDLLLLNLAGRLEGLRRSPEYPSSAEWIKSARSQESSLLVAREATAWDLPMWVASGSLGSVQLCPDFLGPDKISKPKRHVRPPEGNRFRGALAAGRWNESTYYQLLNCGLRIPPTAGSGSGMTTNPLGYNRTYVFCGPDFSYENWMRGLREGKVIVTNGPMMRLRANGRLPGYIFESFQGEPLELEFELQLSTRDPVEYLEIIKNGRVTENVPLNKWVANNGRLPVIRFEESGWVSVRAVTRQQKTYRFASSGPFYVEFDGKPRISKSAAQFFLDWEHKRAKQIHIKDADQREEVIRFHRAARDFWKKRIDQANAS